MQDGSGGMPRRQRTKRTFWRNLLELVRRAVPVQEGFRSATSEIGKVICRKSFGIDGIGGIQITCGDLPFPGLDSISGFIDVCFEIARRRDLPQDEE